MRTQSNALLYYSLASRNNIVLNLFLYYIITKDYFRTFPSVWFHPRLLSSALCRLWPLCWADCCAVEPMIVGLALAPFPMLLLLWESSCADLDRLICLGGKDCCSWRVWGNQYHLTSNVGSFFNISVSFSPSLLWGASLLCCGVYNYLRSDCSGFVMALWSSNLMLMLRSHLARVPSLSHLFDI